VLILYCFELAGKRKLVIEDGGGLGWKSGFVYITQRSFFVDFQAKSPIIKI
jgi:hypothetical protein